MLYPVGFMIGIQVKRKNPPVESGNVNIAIVANGQMPDRPQALRHDAGMETGGESQIVRLGSQGLAADEPKDENGAGQLHFGLPIMVRILTQGARLGQSFWVNSGIGVVS